MTHTRTRDLYYKVFRTKKSVTYCFDELYHIEKMGKEGRKLDGIKLFTTVLPP